MNATRRLDVLAVIGGLIALAVIAVQVYYPPEVVEGVPYWSGERAADASAIRKALLKRMPDSDIRADFEALAPWNIIPEPRARELEEAVRKYPNSARLNFRLGTLHNYPRSSEALRRAAELDPENALPLYLLASAAVKDGNPNQALDLVIQGNRRSRVDYYPLPYEPCERNGLLEIMVRAANYSAKLPGNAYLRRIAMGIGRHTDDLRSTGRTDEALAAIGQVRQMAWKLMQDEDAEVLDVLVGIAIIKICQKHEKQIYTETGSKAGLAQIEETNTKLRYLLAGSSAYIDRSMRQLTRRIAVSMAPSVSISPAALELWFVLVVLGIWAALALRTRGKAASELHEQAASRAFTFRGLLGLYAPTFLPIGVAAGVVYYLSAGLALQSSSLVAPQTNLWTIVGLVAIGAAVVLPSIILHCRAAGIYKKTYRQVSEEAGSKTPALWKGVPTEEKREVARRLAGVHGGAMIFMLLWGLLVSGGMKLTLDAFPWQVERATAGMVQEEQRYVADLVAGKIKVPEKYIHEVEQREKESEERAAQKAD